MVSRPRAFGDVRWDGTYITLTNPSRKEIYRLTLSKSSLRIIGMTHVHDWHSGYSGRWPYIQTWLNDKIFLAHSSAGAQLGLWAYPAGGSPSKLIGPFESGDINVFGIALSALRAGVRLF